MTREADPATCSASSGKNRNTGAFGFFARAGAWQVDASEYITAASAHNTRHEPRRARWRQ